MQPVAIIRKRKGKYHLISHKGKTLGVHSTREEALKQEQAIEISKRAKQLADGISKLLAEQDRDDHGRFSGPGGGGGHEDQMRAVHLQHAEKAAKSAAGKSRRAHKETIVTQGTSSGRYKSGDERIAEHKSAARSHQLAADHYKLAGEHAKSAEHQQKAQEHQQHIDSIKHSLGIKF